MSPECTRIQHYPQLHPNPVKQGTSQAKLLTPSVNWLGRYQNLPADGTAGQGVCPKDLGTGDSSPNVPQLQICRFCPLSHLKNMWRREDLDRFRKERNACKAVLWGKDAEWGGVHTCCVTLDTQASVSQPMSEVPWATGFQGWWILRIPWGTCGGQVLRWPGVSTSN